MFVRNVAWDKSPNFTLSQKISENNSVKPKLPHWKENLWYMIKWKKENSQKPNIRLTIFNIKKVMAENKSYVNISKDIDQFLPKLNSIIAGGNVQNSII